MLIAILDDYQNIALSLADWRSIGKDVEITVFNEHMNCDETVANALVNFDVVVAMRERTAFSANLLSRLPKLKLLVSTGVRNRSIDLQAAVSRGIVVCGTPLIPYAPTEFTWGLILGIIKGIPADNVAMHRGKWQTQVGQTLKDKTLGIIGLGNLGGQMATIGRTFGMQIIAWSENLTEERAAECGAQRVPLDVLMATADIVTIHLYLSDRTYGIIGAHELNLMKPSAYLVNIARGPIIDESALIDTLQKKKIAGAALDVFDIEPLPVDHPFRSLDNTLLTPHMGVVAEEGLRVMYEGAVENIRLFRTGQPVQLLKV